MPVHIIYIESKYRSICVTVLDIFGQGPAPCNIWEVYFGNDFSIIIFLTGNKNSSGGKKLVPRKKKLVPD